MKKGNFGTLCTVTIFVEKWQCEHWKKQRLPGWGGLALHLRIACRTYPLTLLPMPIQVPCWSCIEKWLGQPSCSMSLAIERRLALKKGILNTLYKANLLSIKEEPLRCTRFCLELGSCTLMGCGSGLML